MITGTLPTTNEKQKIAARRLIHIQPENKKKSFLYIGKNGSKAQNCLYFFDSGYTTESFKDARQLLNDLYELEIIPDFIIVDLPLDKKEFPDFILWLHSNKWSFMIPVMYNETILNDTELRQLKELNIADDIVDIKEYCTQLNSKAGLLKESKLTKKFEKKEDFSSAGKRENTPISKRTFDILIASTLLLITLPLFLIISLIIKLESKGPVIYSSKRAGRGFKVFNFLKFRTMVQDADKIIEKLSAQNIYGVGKDKSSFFKLKNDPRITRFGHFLRNTSLDELPQLINVIRGDMSIVGNRPLPLYEASTLTSNRNVERFSAPAGITGLWQVTKRGDDDMDVEERVRLDVYYARKQGFLLDFRILMATPLAMIQKSNVQSFAQFF